VESHPSQNEGWGTRLRLRRVLVDFETLKL